MSNSDLCHFDNLAVLFVENLDTFMAYMIISYSSFVSIILVKEIVTNFNAISHYMLSDERVDQMLKPDLRSRVALALLLTVNLAGSIISLYALTITDFLSTFFFHSLHATDFQLIVYIGSLMALLFCNLYLASVFSRLTGRIRELRQQRNSLHRSLVNLFPALPSEKLEMETLDPSYLKEVKQMIDFDVQV